MAQYDFYFKLLLVGDTGVGKTSLLARLAGEKHAEDPLLSNIAPTVGVDFITKYFQSWDKMCRLQIWDSAGQERFRALITAYFHGVHLALVAYDVNNLQTFNNVRMWNKIIERNAPAKTFKVLVANKADSRDMPRCVSVEQGQALAVELGFIGFFELSASATTHAIEEIFQFCCDSLVMHASPAHVPRGDKEEGEEGGEGAQGATAATVAKGEQQQQQQQSKKPQPQQQPQPHTGLVAASASPSSPSTTSGGGGGGGGGGSGDDDVDEPKEKFSSLMHGPWTPQKSNVLVSGWIKKRRGQWPHFFQRNWLVLTPTALSYGPDSSPEGRVHGTVPLLNIVMVTVTPGSLVEFNVKTPHRMYVMQTESEAARVAWVAAIQKAMKHVPFECLTLGPAKYDPEAVGVKTTFVCVATRNKGFRVAFALSSASRSASKTSSHSTSSATSPSSSSSLSSSIAGMPATYPNVYSAFLASIPIKLAYKSVRLTALNATDHTARLRDFQNEISFLRSTELKHANVVRFFGHGTAPIAANGCAEAHGLVDNLAQQYEILPFSVLEWMDASLADVIFDVRCALLAEEAIKVLQSCANAVAYLHSQSPPIFHGRISVENFLIDEFWTVKLSGFGDARTAMSTQETFGDAVGLSGYTPPEILRGQRWGIAADIFALCVTLFEVIHRRPAYFFHESPFKSDKDRAAALPQGLVPVAPPSATVVAKAISGSEFMTTLLDDGFKMKPEARPWADKLADLLLFHHLFPPNQKLTQQQQQQQQQQQLTKIAAACPTWLPDKLRELHL